MVKKASIAIFGKLNGSPAICVLMIYNSFDIDSNLTYKLLDSLSNLSNSSDRELAQWHLYLNFSELDDNGVYTWDINKEIDRFFSILSSETKHKIRKSTRSKIFAKLVKYKIWHTIKTRKKIRDKSPQSLSRTKGTKKDKRGGPYVLYKNTARIKNYRGSYYTKQHKSKPSYKNLLRNFYAVWLDIILNMIKERGNQTTYAALMIPAIGKGIGPRNIDWEPFKNALNDNQNKNKLKSVKEAFISDLIRNPNKDLFSILLKQ